jgi:hypothetical protein
MNSADLLVERDASDLATKLNKNKSNKKKLHYLAESLRRRDRTPRISSQTKNTKNLIFSLHNSNDV